MMTKTLTNKAPQVSIRQIAGLNYDEFWLTLKDAYWVAFKTGKSAKKSRLIALTIALLSLADPTSSHVVLRKLMKDHANSTLNDLEWAFQKISEISGQDGEKEWKVYRSQSNIKIENLRTGQQIRFASFDKPNSLAGYSLKKSNLAFGILWFEEPFQIGEKEDAEIRKRNFEKFETIISSVHRGDLPHEKFIQKVILTTNDGSADGDPLIDKFWAPIFENIEILENLGKQTHYDPNYENGKGLLTMVASGGINEFQTDRYLQFIKGIKKRDYQFYKAIGLGTASSYVGNAYGDGNLEKISRKIRFEKIFRFSIGWDYSSTKDWTVISLVGGDPVSKLVQVVDAKRYHRGREKIPMREPDLVKTLGKIILSWHDKFNFQRLKNKVSILGDSRDSLVTSYLQEFGEDASPIIQESLLLPKPALKVRQASNYVRLMAFRHIIGSGNFVIAPHLDGLLDEFRAAKLDAEGIVKDRGDDGRQSVEYALSRKLQDLVPNQLGSNIVYYERERAVLMNE